MPHTDIVTAIELAFFRRAGKSGILLEHAIEELAAIKEINPYRFKVQYEILVKQVEMYYNGIMGKEMYWKFSKLVFYGDLDRDIDEEIEEMEEEIMQLENKVDDLRDNIKELRKSQKDDVNKFSWML